MTTNFKSVMLVALLSLMSLGTKAQLTIAVERGGQTYLYETFNAFKATVADGDVIYFPGRGINIGNWEIDKQVTVYGTGHNPTETAATYRTELNGSITLKTGADGSSFQGFYLTGNFALGNTDANQVVNNITLSRCNVNEVFLSNNSGTTATTANSITIRENVVRGVLRGGYASNVTVSNNIFNSILTHFKNALIANNIMLLKGYWSNLFAGISNSMLKNNIMLMNGYGSNIIGSNVESNDFSLNIIAHGMGFPTGTNIASASNWSNIDVPNDVLVQVGYDAHNYAHDYHLKPEVIATYKGTDNKQVGIYGGLYPWKEGSSPINPHIFEKTISEQTDADGKINVQIKVKAQDN